MMGLVSGSLTKHTFSLLSCGAKAVTDGLEVWRDSQCLALAVLTMFVIVGDINWARKGKDNSCVQHLLCLMLFVFNMQLCSSQSIAGLYGEGHPTGTAPKPARAGYET